MTGWVVVGSIDVVVAGWGVVGSVGIVSSVVLSVVCETFISVG